MERFESHWTVQLYTGKHNTLPKTTKMDLLSSFSPLKLSFIVMRLTHRLAVDLVWQHVRPGGADVPQMVQHLDDSVPRRLAVIVRHALKPCTETARSAQDRLSGRTTTQPPQGRRQSHAIQRYSAQ